MICSQIVKKLFYKLSDFERARSPLLQFYASSALQRYGNNHSEKGLETFLLSTVQQRKQNFSITPNSQRENDNYV